MVSAGNARMQVSRWQSMPYWHTRIALHCAELLTLLMMRMPWGRKNGDPGLQ